MQVTTDYSAIDKKVAKIIKIAQSYMNWSDAGFIELEIQKAYLYAREAHEWVFRHSGEPYIDHPVAATLILLQLKPDIFTIQSCLLHDVVEDTPRTLQDIDDNFGPEVAYICSGMEKLSKVKYKWEERSIGSLRKMFVAMSEDIRVIFVKLSDRMHNMQTLKFHPKKDKRERIALETLNIYAPIADRLGLHKMKNDLDEECFKILHPSEYKDIKKQLFASKASIEAFKTEAKKEIETALQDIGISYEIDFRVKSVYSIYKKMKKKWYENINDLHDIYGIKILVWDIADCYRVLWMVHNIWTPLPNRFKDYIALPKPNGYRSLHTTILWLLKKFRKQPTEIQIKTHSMEIESSIWVAAHFEYKEKWSLVARDIHWVKEIKDLIESLWNNDFIDSLKIDLFKDRIFVLTPNGDTINLPVGSTAIDFAYEIHTDLGNHITLAKVNGSVYPLDKELKNGDMVEVIIDKNKKPNPFYISIVKTTKAKNSIRSFLRNEDRDLHKERGREILNKHLEKYNLDKLDKDMTALKNIDDRELSVEERYDLLEQVWNFSTNPWALVRKIFKAKNLHFKSLTEKKTPVIREVEKKESKEIIIGSEKNIPYKIGVCCEESLSDKIVAYINSKWVITIHNRDCKTLSRLNKERLLSAYFEGDELNNIILEIKFIFANKLWVLKSLSDILFEMGMNTLEISSKRPTLDKTELSLKLEIQDHDYLIIDRFLDRVKLEIGKNLLDFEIKHIDD